MTWPARVSIIINSVIAFYIVPMMFLFAEHQWEEWHVGGTSEALALRLGSVAVNLMLWAFLGSNAVRDFVVRQSHQPGRAFDVIMKEPGAVPPPHSHAPKGQHEPQPRATPWVGDAE